jgi:glycosyltransferase involved in cell wall biosynthesis
LNPKLKITAIVMTLNERLNLDECLISIAEFIDEIIVVDCYSTDNTL